MANHVEVKLDEQQWARLKALLADPVEEPEPPADPDDVADVTWIGREVMVTYSDASPWYDGKVTRVTECGGFVEVESLVPGWFGRMRPDRTWHDVDVVYVLTTTKTYELQIYPCAGCGKNEMWRPNRHCKDCLRSHGG